MLRRRLLLAQPRQLPQAHLACLTARCARLRCAPTAPMLALLARLRPCALLRLHHLVLRALGRGPHLSEVRAES